MKIYNVSGMSCAACSARVEKAVSKVEGVTACTVNLLTNSMSVEGNADNSDIIAAVYAAGYGASIKKDGPISKEKSIDENDIHITSLKNRFIVSAIILIALMYISMGHIMWGFPLPKMLSENYMLLGIAQLIFTIAIMIINRSFFINGIKGIINRSPNMDTLVSLGAAAAFGYSCYSLWIICSFQIDGNLTGAMKYMHELYFESAAMILTLITMGRLLEARSKARTADAIRSLVDLAPKTANIIRNNCEVTIDIDDLSSGDIFVVRPGEKIPADGIIIEGSTSIDESAVTGESIPVDKAIGDNVYSASINHSGFIKCKASHNGKEGIIFQIIRMVSEATATKAPVSRLADKISGIFVPAVILIAVITFIIWLIAGNTLGFALARSISVLVISCPCALGLATPVAVMVGSGTAARYGILFKNATSLEQTGKIKTVVFDKTGTVTVGKPSVTDVFPIEGISKNELIKLAYSLEYASEHPLGRAVCEKAVALEIERYPAENFENIPGNGVLATVNKDLIFGGKISEAASKAEIPDEFLLLTNRLSDQGKTPLCFVKNNIFIGLIAVADTVKPESKDAVSLINKLGIKTIMLTGDNERTARAIGKQVGINEIISGVLPQQKSEVVSRLKGEGYVAMVGDGINDAPALASADTGIAIGAGTDVAIDAADVILMKSNLMDAPYAIMLSRAALTNIKQNLFWAFIYNIIGIPLAAGAFIPLFGWQMNPMFSAAAMSISSFCVVTNSLRLNTFNPQKYVKKLLKTNIIGKDRKNMKKTINIEGMMCGHCSAHVKKALESLAQVKNADVSHETGSAIVILNSTIDDGVLTAVIEKEGYKVTDIQ